MAARCSFLDRALAAFGDRTGRQGLVRIDGDDRAARRKLGQLGQRLGVGIERVDKARLVPGLVAHHLGEKDLAGFAARLERTAGVAVQDVLDLARAHRHQIDPVTGRHDQLGASVRVGVLGEVEAVAVGLGRQLDDAVAGVGIDPRAGQVLGPGGERQGGEGGEKRGRDFMGVEAGEGCAFGDLDGVDSDRAPEIRAEDDPLAVGREEPVRLERVVVAREVDQPLGHQLRDLDHVRLVGRLVGEVRNQLGAEEEHPLRVLGLGIVDYRVRAVAGEERPVRRGVVMDGPVVGGQMIP